MVKCSPGRERLRTEGHCRVARLRTLPDRPSRRLRHRRRTGRPSFAQPLSKADYEACQARDEASFKTAIQAISVRALQAGIANVDYRAAVGDQWRRIGMDEIVDDRVDLAIEEVRQETSWGNLLQSLANQQKAQELATAVAERVYRSDAIKAALEQLAVGVGNEIGKQMEFASQDAAEPALACLKAFVGARYGETASRAVVGDAGKEIDTRPQQGRRRDVARRRAA